MEHRTRWADSSPALQDHDDGDGVSFSTMDGLVQSSSRPYELLQEEKTSREEEEDAQREAEEVRDVEADQPFLPRLSEEDTSRDDEDGQRKEEDAPDEEDANR